MNVQDKQRGSESPAVIAGTDAGSETRNPKRAEQAPQGASRVEKAVQEQALRLQSDIDKAMNLAAEMSCVTLRVLTSRNRWERPCMMRQIVAYWLNVVQGYDKALIGRYFCRDRSSIYHAVNRIAGLLKIGDRQTTELWNEFNERIIDYKPKPTETMEETKPKIVVPEWQLKREYYASILTNLLFEVADVLETLFVECSDAYKDCTFQFTKEQKNHFKFAHKHIKDLRSFTKKLDPETQVKFGDDAEIIADLIYAAVSRTGTDDDVMRGFLEHIMQQPDKLGLDGIRKGGALFEEIKLKLAKARIEAKLNENKKPTKKTK